MHKPANQDGYTKYMKGKMKGALKGVYVNDEGMFSKSCPICENEVVFKVIGYSSRLGRSLMRFYCTPCQTRRRKAWRQTEGGKEMTRNAITKTIAKYPYKKDARVILNMNLKLSRITKPDKCERCNTETKIYAHHPDYSKPLEVVWLCMSDHVKEHPRKKLMHSFSEAV